MNKAYYNSITGHIKYWDQNYIEAEKQLETSAQSILSNNFNDKYLELGQLFLDNYSNTPIFFKENTNKLFNPMDRIKYLTFRNYGNIIEPKDTIVITFSSDRLVFDLDKDILFDSKVKKVFQDKNKIVKLIVRKKSDPKNFEKFIDKLYSSGIQDLKIIENFVIEESESFEIEEEESTISILNRYIDESDIEFDKNIIKNIFQDLYRQACEVE